MSTISEKQSIAIVQPQFAPNLYDFAAMLKADRVIWNDLETWSRKGRTHRAVIKGEQGKQWINIPIKTEDKKKAIHQVRIEHNEEWMDSFWHAIVHSYSEATWFDFFETELHHDIKMANEFEKLIDFNHYFFNRLLHYVECPIVYERAGQIPDFNLNPDVFIDELGEVTLYQEHDSKNYQWRSDAAVSALDHHPEYPQVGNDFLPECSLIDVLLNCGKESFRVFDAL